MKRIILFLVLALASYAAMAQTIWYVDASSGNANPAIATSWGTACDDLQAVINNANSGDQIWVKEGSYIAPAGYGFYLDNSPNLQNLSIYGGFEGWESDLSERDNWNASNNISYLVNSGVANSQTLGISHNTGSIVDGFTITGSIYHSYFAPVFVGGYSDVILSNLVLKGNESGVTIVYIEGSAETPFSTKLINVEISDNMVDNGWFPGYGIIYSLVSNVELHNLTVANNNSNTGYVLVASDQSNVGIFNSIFWDSNGTSVDFLNDNSTVDIYHSIIQQSGGGGSGWWTTHNIGDNGGNIEDDPNFVNPQTNGDYRLNGGSPAIDAGNQSYFLQVPPFQNYDLDANARIARGEIDMGAYEFGSGHPVKALAIQKKQEYTLQDREYETVSLYPTRLRSGQSIQILIPAQETTETKNYRAEVYSLQGERLLVKTLSEGISTLALPDIPNGIYIVSLKLDGKLLKQEKVVLIP